jgi:hypothetical protein
MSFQTSKKAWIGYSDLIKDKLTINKFKKIIYLLILILLKFISNSYIEFFKFLGQAMLQAVY